MISKLQNSVDLCEVQKILCNKLINTGWYNKLRFFVNTSEFYDLLMNLYNEVLEDRRFTPGIKEVFRPFEVCHLDQLKVVFLCKEPYLDPSANNGLAISTNLPAKDHNEYQAFLQDIGEFAHSIVDGDLSKWAKQGVLLLNTSLTARIGLENRYEKIWKPFMHTLFDLLNRKDNLFWVSFGPNEWLDSVDNQSHEKKVLKKLPLNKNEEWSSEGVFQKIDEFISFKQFEKIVW